MCVCLCVCAFFFLVLILSTYLCGFADGLLKKLEEMEKTADMYNGLISHTKKLLKTTFELSQSHRGKSFSNVKN